MRQYKKWDDVEKGCKALIRWIVSCETKEQLRNVGLFAAKYIDTIPDYYINMRILSNYIGRIIQALDMKKDEIRRATKNS